jgi:hypothetical protein
MGTRLGNSEHRNPVFVIVLPQNKQLVKQFINSHHLDAKSVHANTSTEEDGWAYKALKYA